jgi:iron complex transport system substrate-binding protein
MVRFGGNDPFRALSDAGTSVIYVPDSATIQDIKNSIVFIADVLGRKDVGEAIVADMTSEIKKIAAIGSMVTERRTVYFEIEPAPMFFTLGAGTFLNDIIELVGARNIFNDQSGWVQINDEKIVVRNPDVILTNVSFIADPIGEIKSRPGWDAMDAVRNNQVFSIPTNASSRSSQFIVDAIIAIARAVYPDSYE